MREKFITHEIKYYPYSFALIHHNSMFSFLWHPNSVYKSSCNSYKMLLVDIPWKPSVIPVTQVKAADANNERKEVKWRWDQHHDSARGRDWLDLMCRHSRPLQNRTEIASMLKVRNKCRRVTRSAVTRAGMRQREGATERGRGTVLRHKAGGN